MEDEHNIHGDNERKRSKSHEQLESFHTTPAHLNLMNHQRHFSALHNDTGNDSDTNSHCALIVSDSDSRSKTRTQKSTNGNNNYELHELQELDRIKPARNRNRI